jgi:hypothetical protein
MIFLFDDIKAEFSTCFYVIGVLCMIYFVAYSYLLLPVAVVLTLVQGINSINGDYFRFVTLILVSLTIGSVLFYPSKNDILKKVPNKIELKSNHLVLTYSDVTKILRLEKLRWSTASQFNLIYTDFFYLGIRKPGIFFWYIDSNECIPIYVQLDKEKEKMVLEILKKSSCLPIERMGFRMLVFLTFPSLGLILFFFIGHCICTLFGFEIFYSFFIALSGFFLGALYTRIITSFPTNQAY